MKHYYKLTCFFFRYLKWIVLGCTLLTAAVQLGWLWYYAQQPQAVYATYQNIVYDSQRRLHISSLFTLCFSLLCICFSVWLYACFKGKRCPLYTLLTLPGDRAALPTALFTSVLLAFFFYFLCECAVLFAGYHLWAQVTPAATQAYLAQLHATDPEAYTLLYAAGLQPYVNNDLYLSFVHSPVGYLVLPPTPLYWLYSLGLITLLSSLYAFDLFFRSSISYCIVILVLIGSRTAVLHEHAPAFGIFMLGAALTILATAIRKARKHPTV